MHSRDDLFILISTILALALSDTNCAVFNVMKAVVMMNLCIFRHVNELNRSLFKESVRD